MSNRASVGIFYKKSNKPIETKPEVPDQLFEIAKIVEKKQNTEILRTEDSFFVITYSPNSIFNQYVQEWMHVQIFCIREWQSGGIKQEELAKYESEKTKQ